MLVVACLLVVCLLVLLAVLAVPRLNEFTASGSLHWPDLADRAEIVRDEKGMAYVSAQTLADVVRVQGFATAQDRLFQMHIMRLLTQGKLAEHFGEQLIGSDRKMLTLGFYPAAQRHAALLDSKNRQLLQNYADGVNRFIQSRHARPADWPFEMQLLTSSPEPWQVADSLAIMYYLGWGSAANLQGELIALALAGRLTAEQYQSIAPIHDLPADIAFSETIGLVHRRRPVVGASSRGATKLALRDLQSETLLCCTPQALQWGSNNWALGSSRSAGGRPVVANDPHLQTDMLPSVLYPMGLRTGQMRAVGASLPGLPGLIIGRNQYLAIGATNAYADTQDLYIEKLDPADKNRYLEGSRSIAFQSQTFEIVVRDRNVPGGFRTENLVVKRTSRGPVVSAVLLAQADSQQHVLTFRWSALEAMGASLGLDYLLTAKSVWQVRDKLRDVSAVSLNMVFADVQGELGWQTTRRVPIRTDRDGARPAAVGAVADDWAGMLPFEQMPARYEHSNDWVGTANHQTVANNMAHYYSAWFAPRFRYQRMTELVAQQSVANASDHWRWMRDKQNVFARELAPLLAEILLAALPQRSATTGEKKICLTWAYFTKLGL